jgi:hypothetical protein
MTASEQAEELLHQQKVGSTNSSSFGSMRTGAEGIVVVVEAEGCREVGCTLSSYERVEGGSQAAKWFVAELAVHHGVNFKNQ